ncbi:hypothetical protein OEW28_10235 [Defluviimonas sp. WL0002]|uniref:Uncharacterized protein n=1 Tax=Albidovulum marisflavi TaxID=2984159 RepID=A0ABT2ZD50_9RHOB|nr:hypothetical protein [Defluviimonas sp. WL0002]MCV2869005.1 hypothetical protein [Defluviimonas sp. WL0002]
MSDIPINSKALSSELPPKVIFQTKYCLGKARRSDILYLSDPYRHRAQARRAKRARNRVMGKFEKTNGSSLAALLSCCALAVVLAAAPSFVPFAGDGWDGAAHAKSDNAGGNGGNNGNGGNKGNSGNKGNNGKSASSKGKAAAVASVETETATLPAYKKGKWNAMNANPQALAAHVANGNFNGTIGALAQANLAAKAASGAELTPEEMAALAGFVDTSDIMADPEAVAAALNEGTDPGVDPQWGVDENGVVSCNANCDGIEQSTIDEKQAEADGIAEDLEAEAIEAAYDQFLEDSKQRIINESNKALSEAEQEQLFDEMGDKWGLDLTPEEEAAAVEGEEVPAEEVLPVEG